MSSLLITTQLTGSPSPSVRDVSVTGWRISRIGVFQETDIGEHLSISGSVLTAVSRCPSVLVRNWLRRAVIPTMRSLNFTDLISTVLRSPAPSAAAAWSVCLRLSTAGSIRELCLLLSTIILLKMRICLSSSSLQHLSPKLWIRQEAGSIH